MALVNVRHSSDVKSQDKSWPRHSFEAACLLSWSRSRAYCIDLLSRLESIRRMFQDRRRGL